MIQIEIKDMHGNDCQLGDVILFHYPSGRIFYLGVLEWNVRHYELVVNDGDTWYPLSEPHKQFERISALDKCPALEKEFGKIHLAKKQNINKIYNMVLEATF